MTLTCVRKPLVQIDLLPKPYRAQAHGRMRLRSLGGLVVVTLAIYAMVNLILVVMSGSDSDAVTVRMDLEREIAAYEKAIKEKKSLLASRQRVLASFAEYDTEKVVIPALLSALGTSTPITITLRQVLLSPSGVDISGVAQDAEAVRRWMVRVSEVCSELEPTLRQLQRAEIGQAVVQEFNAHFTRKLNAPPGVTCVVGG